MRRPCFPWLLVLAVGSSATCLAGGRGWYLVPISLSQSDPVFSALAMHGRTPAYFPCLVSNGSLTTSSRSAAFVIHQHALDCIARIRDDF